MVPLTHNLKKIEVEKMAKYEELAFPLKSIWKLERVVIVPIIISAGVISKKTTKNIEKLAINKNILRVP